jgi:hypothetical protein
LLAIIDGGNLLTRLLRVAMQRKHAARVQRHDVACRRLEIIVVLQPKLDPTKNLTKSEAVDGSRSHGKSPLEAEKPTNVELEIRVDLGSY